jgi:hypothetical protein
LQGVSNAPEHESTKSTVARPASLLTIRDMKRTPLARLWDWLGWIAEVVGRWQILVWIVAAVAFIAAVPTDAAILITIGIISALIGALLAFSGESRKKAAAEGCGCRKLDRVHAARSYSWIRPPRTSRLITDPEGASNVTEGGLGAGGFMSSERWGR